MLKSVVGKAREEVVWFVFFELLMRVEVGEWGNEGFECFEEYFLFVNKQAKLLHHSSDGSIQASKDLIAFEFLWEIFRKARDSDVIRKAEGLLVRLMREGEEGGEGYVKMIQENLVYGYQRIVNDEDKGKRRFKLLF